MRVPNSPAFGPSNPAKTETVSVRMEERLFRFDPPRTPLTLAGRGHVGMDSYPNHQPGQ